jgi:dimethylglycine dehydrogenase
MNEPPVHARVAIIGGGIAGCSAAYHLTRLGESDVVLLEQHELTSGTTWHAAGLCTQFSGSVNLMGLLKRSVELYRELSSDSGALSPYHETGSLRLATTPDRIDEFEHAAGVASLVGVPFEIVHAERAAELFPLLDPSGILGAAYLPTDGWVDPSTVAHLLAKQAQARGARILRHTPVTGLERITGGWKLSTPNGNVLADAVLCAAGQWAREVAALAGAHLPLVSLPHHYVFTAAGRRCPQ